MIRRLGAFRKRRHLPILVAPVVAILVAGLALGHTPIPHSYSTNPYSDNKSLPWDFYGSYASWFTSAAITSLDTNWDDPSTNNSKAPNFSFTLGGAGTVRYSSSANSPCSGAAPYWIGCAAGGGTTTWRIYLRDFVASPTNSETWYNITGTCPSGKVCFKLERTLIHEPIHLSFGTAHSDGQGVSDTIFTTGQHSYANTGWNYIHLQKCDQAAAQLLYDVFDKAGDYGDCFDHLANHGTDGLKTDLSASIAAVDVCQGTPVTVTGRAQIHDYTSYAKLAKNSLEARVIEFDVNGVPTVYTTTVTDTVAPATNWTKTFTNVGTGSKNYVAHIDLGGTTGLDSPPNKSFSIAWLPPLIC